MLRVTAGKPATEAVKVAARSIPVVFASALRYVCDVCEGRHVVSVARRSDTEMCRMQSGWLVPCR